MRRQTTALVLLTTTLLLPISPALADWRDDLQRVERHLGEDDSASAARITRRLTEEWVEKLAPGEAAERAFGSLLALRAMAEAAEGLEDDARFHWRLATHFRPDLVRSDLERYGEGGRLVAAWRAAAKEVRPPVEEASAYAGPIHVGGAVEPPRKLPPIRQPQYTEGARADRIQGLVILQTVIDKAGRITDVKILDSLHPGLDYRAAEAVRAWHFEPARLDGEPVDIYYNLTISFSLQGVPWPDSEGEEPRRPRRWPWRTAPGGQP